MKNFFKKIFSSETSETTPPAPKNWNTWKVQYERLAGHLITSGEQEFRYAFDHWMGNLTPEESFAHLKSMGFFK